ncbi:hypothetical protein PsYK624_057490 [Phanerochaete sordida]|uniref:F-box domain-containing protein n=1 Tax=Phanerochaete sordida TaxID=48140 RepID=A0A9P3G862_9APHY|nr:hypothetical protein PsYK624_057490 [Phanerochaete sordida]
MLPKLPFTILEHIGLEVAVVDPLGPPSDLISLLCTCRHIHSCLSFDNNRHLYARIFRQKFDTRAVVRRFGDRCTRLNTTAAQLKVYCELLKRIRRGDTAADPETIKVDFRMALFMFLENDGRNEAQLQWAGLGAFVDRFVRTRLREGCDQTAGWPPESEMNALALWLLWFTTDEVTLREETADARRELMELVRPYVVLPVRYPAFWQPDYHFEFPIPDGRPAYRAIGPHGYYPTYRHPDHLGLLHKHRGLRFRASVPPISLAAKLIYFARSEAMPFHIPTALPATREAAIELGFTDIRPTQEDYLRFNQHKAAAPIKPASFEWYGELNEEEARQENEGVWKRTLRSKSAKWDLDWYRMLYCFDPWYVSDIKPLPYMKGMLDGDWEGRMLLPDFQQYHRVATSSRFDPQQPMMTTVPISLRLREYHSVSPKVPIPRGGPPRREYIDHFNDGIMRAWLPDDWEIREGYGKLRPQDPNGRQVRQSEYVRWQEGTPNGHNPATCTMCIQRAEEEQRALLASQKKRKSPSDMDEDEDDSGAEDRARSKRARARSPSTRRQDPAAAQPAVIAHDAGIADIAEDLRTTGGLAEDRTEVQAPFGPGSQLDDLIDAEMKDPNASAPCDGVQDIMVVGETLPKHGQAWHHYRFYGRVRRYDGLVAIVRVPTFVSELGTTIFRGYIVGGQHFVGNWRPLSAARSAIPLEGPFIMSRSSTAQ